MGKQSILSKVGTLLAAPDLKLEQCHVLYVMVEIRKVLEQDSYPADCDVLRFYGNWCAHPAIESGSPFKDMLIPVIKNAIQQYVGTQETIKKGSDLALFLSLELLRRNLHDFLKKHGIRADATGGAKWQDFRSLLFKIVSEQQFKPRNQGFAVEYGEDGSGFIEFVLADQSVDRMYFFQQDLG